MGVGDPRGPQRGNRARDRAQACHGEAREAYLRGEEEGEGCRDEDHKSKEGTREEEDGLQGKGKEDVRGGEEAGEVHDGEDRGEEGEDEGECRFHDEDREEGHGEVGEEEVRKRGRRIDERYVASHQSRCAKHTELHHSP